MAQIEGCLQELGSEEMFTVKQKFFRALWASGPDLPGELPQMAGRSAAHTG